MNHKITATVAAALLAASLTACTSPGAQHHGTPPNDSGISQGLASRDARADVTLGRPVNDTYGGATLKITYVNHSSQRSDYWVSVSAENATHTRQYDTAEDFVQNLEPGQTKVSEAMFLNDIPAGAVIVIKSIERTASV
jgi:hypothetical protein